MTTFQALVYAITHGISWFLPIGGNAHSILIPFLVGWQPPVAALVNGLMLGSTLALFLYYRHDWASMISCLLQVIIFRKRPMTLDERLPIFVGISNIPIFIATYYFRDRIAEVDWSPLLVTGILTLSGFILLFFDSIGRKKKGMFDWNGWDALVVGVAQASAIVPGWDPLGGALLGALFLNYKREPAVKYAFFTMAPVLITKTISSFKEVNFGAGMPAPELSWLSYSIAVLIACLAGLLAIGGLNKHVQTRGVGQYVVYRCLLGLAVCGALWIRSRS